MIEIDHPLCSNVVSKKLSMIAQGFSGQTSPSGFWPEVRGRCQNCITLEVIE